MEAQEHSALLANPDGRAPPPEKESAGPAGPGTGTKRKNTARLPYHHPARAAIREERAAKERALRAAFAVEVEACGAGAPIPAFDGDDEQARLWAGFAGSRELMAYRRACEHELERRHGERETLRRRFVELWGRLAAADRLAFIERVNSERRAA